MTRDPARTVYIGNLDEKVNDRVLYEILIQVGRVVDLYIPRDKETNRHKGYAFAEYESAEVADYAVRLFSGIVRLNNKTLKFAISGQDKPSLNIGTPIAPKPSLAFLPKSTSIRASDTDSCSHPVSSINSRSSTIGIVSHSLCSENHQYSRRL